MVAKLALDCDNLIASLEKSKAIILTIDREDNIQHVSPEFGALVNQPFSSLFPGSDHRRAQSLLRKARSRNDISVLFRGSLENLDDMPLAILMGPLLDNERADIFCMLINWHGESDQPEVIGAEILSGMKSIHRLSNRVAAMRLNAEIAALSIGEDEPSLDEMRETVASIVEIAQSIEQDIMRLAPYLSNSGDLTDNSPLPGSKHDSTQS